MIASGVRAIDFWRTKYGAPLLADVGEVGALRGFIQTREPHVLRFTEVFFVTEGRGALAIDDHVYDVAPGAVLVTGPGEVRQWRLAAPLRGVAAFFEEDLARSLFADPASLAVLAPRAHGGGARVALAERHRARTLTRLGRMIATLRARGPAGAASLHVGLRDVLLSLERAAAARLPHPASGPRLVRAFHALVEARFRELPRVADYAALLGVTPEHLSRAVTRAGAPPSEVIHRRLLLEAKRGLLFTTDPVHVIAERLGFEYPSYFVRFFKRGAGVTPRAFRRSLSA